jgi:dihydrodipicolinate synthase/N-acetylneuraminate lyase
MKHQPYFITAIATPLHEDDTLHEEGLERLIADQREAGINGLLVGGTMGVMQLLTDETYHQLVKQSVDMARGHMEIMVGVGDTSLARTRQRMAFVNTLPIDAVVVVPPYWLPFNQNELIDYYRILADESHAPLFLYDNPAIFRTKIELETVLALAEHPNIGGIKCSDEPSYARQLTDLLGNNFRVIMAAPLLMDVFLRQGLREHLDGIFCLCPRQVVAIGRAVMQGENERAAQIQQGINQMMRLLRKEDIWSAFTVLMHQRGLPGRFMPRPHRLWDAEKTQRFLQEAEAQAVLQFLGCA